ncbi:MAG TPA: hypothetical protein VFP10_12330 [Candidatus Eisenbacteria bacterium]|nr:hypothetical protein [Candidatus Eisenbacteria bacterium]
MAEDETREDEHEDEEREEDGAEDEREDEEDGAEEESDPAKLRAELTKAARRRDRALQRARDAEARLAKLENKDGKDEPDPVAEANGRLVRAEAKSVLAAAGVTDREDQAEVLGFLNLSDIEVDSRGDVDTDTLEERVQRLREIFAGTAASNGRRRPRVDTRDKGRAGGSASDPDAARYKRILGRR